MYRYFYLFFSFKDSKKPYIRYPVFQKNRIYCSHPILGS